MTDPKLVVTKEVWDTLTDDQKLKITYDTAISTRETILQLSVKVDNLALKPCPLAGRIESLERNKILKTIITAFGSIAGGFGGSHIPK